MSFGARSSYFFGTRPTNTSGGSTTWSSTLTRIMSSICMMDLPLRPRSTVPNDGDSVRAMGALTGTTAFLTGGAGGIGRATTRMLLADGAHVVIGSRNAERLAAEAERLAPVADEGGGSIRWTVCDSLDEEQVRTAVDLAAEPTGRLDAAVAIAGGGPLAPVRRYSAATLEDTMRRNTTSPYAV